MSTRRARIKAITSLPVRRKNADNANNTKNKQPRKDCINKTPKSPRTPRRVLQNQDEDKKSPAIKTTPPETNPIESSSIIVRKNLNEDSYSYEIKVSVESPRDTSTPQRVAEVPVMTPNLKFKPDTSIPSCSSSPQHDVASPLVPSPNVSQSSSNNVAVIVQRPATPVKGRAPAAHTIDENNELHITSLNVNSVNYNSAASKTVMSDDYNVPSVPESIENEGVMDGIVPLQAEKNVPKPIDLLKNEIISENAKVLFDPIVPLPSPTKVRSKLRPTPRLGPLRRGSIQGSASESEDENRRANLGSATTPGLVRQQRDSHTSFSNSALSRNTKRMRNDSVCSSASQMTATMGMSSPVKEKTSNKNKRREVCRRMAEVKRRRETLNPESLTMYDLIFYNPTTNPLVPNQDEIKAKEESIKDDLERKKAEKEKEENKKAEKPAEAPVADSAPVPQIKLGANGEIIIDKDSLVIKQTDANRDVSMVVREGSWGTGKGKYTRTPRTADWTGPETVRFYRALASLGTDFSLMAELFPDRTRRDLKVKFKKEEKLNCLQVDKALRMGNTWDPNGLKKEFQSEREAAANKVKNAAEKLKLDRLKEKERIKRSRELRVRNSRAAKALESTMLPGVNNPELTTVDEIVDRALQKRSVPKPKPVRVPENPPPPVEVPTTPSVATLTLIDNGQMIHGQTQITDNMDTISTVNPPVEAPPLNLNTMPNVPANIETGSLVVLTVSDPNSPSKKMLQTYIAHSAGRLTPVALPPAFLNSVVGYIKKGTPKSTVSSNSSPQLTSPTNSVVSQDSRVSGTTPQSNAHPSPVKGQGMSSYTMTQL